jgi:hypothetical protein
MLVLKILGTLEEAQTFPGTLPVDWSRRLRGKTERKVAFLKQNLEMAKRYGVDKDFLKQMENAVHKATFMLATHGFSGKLGWRRSIIKMLLK